MTSISVIIPTYNRVGVLKRVLESLLSQRSPNNEFEIIVVDDCSVDQTREYFSNSPELNVVKYFRNQINLGRVATRNVGIAIASGDILIFLDDDNIPCDDFVISYRKLFQQFGKGFAFIGSPSYPEKSVVESNLVRYLNSRYFGNRADVSECDVGPANFGTLNCAAWKSDVLNIGCFDVDFRYYGGEDEYMGYCLVKSGVKLRLCSGARSVHVDEISIDRYKKKIQESTFFGARLLMKKAPDYYLSTKFRFIFYGKLGRLCRVIIFLLAALTLAPLEFVLRKTDRVRVLYFPSIYRILVLFWTVKAWYADRHLDFVTYRPEV